MEPGQIQITRPGGASVVLHHGTDRFATVYKVNEFEPFERTNRAEQTGDIAWGDGEWSGAEWRAGTVIPLRLGIHTSSWNELMSAWWALDAALAPVRTGSEVEVTWNAAGTEYLVYARPRKAKLRNQNGRTGKAWVEAELFCPDPAIYSATEHVEEMGMLRRIGGTPIPLTVPTTFYSVVADGEATLANTGPSPARLQLRIDGPATRPYITLATATGAMVLNFDTVLGVGDWLDIDTATKTVILNGSISRLRDAWGDWPLLSGEALIRFEAESYNPAARLTVRWRDTY
jgi:hypothetical protein